MWQKQKEALQKVEEKALMIEDLPDAKPKNFSK